tara:strand:+ start:4534 stop:5184 length:651 start_codon:yes stop_codon:yes gene_type:complete
MLIVLIIVAFVGFAIWYIRNQQFVNFTINEKSFQLEKYSPGHTQSLNTLVKIRQKLDALIERLKSKYPNDKLVKRLEERFKNTVLREANPDGDPTQTSYTINKGDTMVICLRANNGRVVDINTLMYVAIHELAHVYSSSYHHNPEFWKNMQFLVNEATELGIYRDTDYKDNPVRYCGIIISSNIPRTELPNQRGMKGGAPLDMIGFLLNHSKVVFA